MCTFNKTVVCVGVWVMVGVGNSEQGLKKCTKSGYQQQQSIQITYKTGYKTTGVLKN